MIQAELVADLVRRGRAASERVGQVRTDVKDGGLRQGADALEDAWQAILAENAVDLAAGHENALAAPLLERLTLDRERVAAMATGLREVAALPDPVGEITRMWNRPNGLQVGRMRIPLGVILVIYESRPNVTADVAALCLKSGNAAILRGGSEAIHSNRAIAAVLREAFASAGVPEDALVLVPRTEREIVDALLLRDDAIDLVIPRGGEALIRRVAEKSRIPVIKHYKGVCHVYLDEFAEPKMASDIAVNSKLQRVSVCNAAETLLVHAALAETILPDVLGALAAHGVQLQACPRTLAHFPSALPSTEEDFHPEGLAHATAARPRDPPGHAIDPIRRYAA